MTFAVEHREIAHREAECARLQPAAAPLLDQRAKSNLGFREGIYSHGLKVLCPAEP